MPLGPTVHHQVCPVIVRLLNFAQKGRLQCKQHTWNRDRMGSKSQKLHHDVVMCPAKPDTQGQKFKKLHMTGLVL